MKKLSFIFIFIFGIFFLGFSNVNASTKLGINFDANEHFNYYYEQKNNTKFYNIIKNPSNFIETYGKEANEFYIFYVKDVYIQLKDSDNPVDLPDNAKYVIVASRVSSNESLLDYTYNGDILTINDFRGISYDVGASNKREGVYVFDDNANCIFSNNDTNTKVHLNSPISFNLSGLKIDDKFNDDYSYFSSMKYYDSSPNSIDPSPLHKFIITDIMYDENQYVLTDNDNYSSFFAKIRAFFGGKNLDTASAIDFNLKYYKEKPINLGDRFPTLHKIITSSTIVNPPKGYSSLTLNDKNYAVTFFPKVIDNEQTDVRKFYYSTNEAIDFDKLVLNVSLYDVNRNYVKSDKNHRKSLKFKRPYSLFVYNPQNHLDKLKDNANIKDYTVVFANGVSLFDSIIYYNPTYYSYCISNDSSNASCVYTDINGVEHTLTQDELYEMLSKDDQLGVSVNIADNWTNDEYCETTKNYSDLYEYDDNCNIVGVKSSAGSSGFISTLSDITSWLKGFSAVIVTIFSYFTLFFSSLPDEIRYCLLFGLVGGTIVLIYKLIRG